MHSDPDPEHDQFPQATQSDNTNLVFFNTVDISGKINCLEKDKIGVI